MKYATRNTIREKTEEKTEEKTGGGYVMFCQTFMTFH